MKKLTMTILCIAASTAHASPFFASGAETAARGGVGLDDLGLKMVDVNPEDGSIRSELSQDDEVVAVLEECVDAHAVDAWVSSILIDDLYEDRTMLSVLDEVDEEAWTDALVNEASAEVYTDDQTDAAVDDCMMARGVFGIQASVLFHADGHSESADKSCEEEAKAAWDECMERASEHAELSDRQAATKACGDAQRVALHDCAKKK